MRLSKKKLMLLLEPVIDGSLNYYYGDPYYRKCLEEKYGKQEVAKAIQNYKR